MKEFEPIDWEFYVTKWNSQRKKGDTIEDITENNLPEEGESKNNESEKKKDEKKEEKKEEKKDEPKEEAPSSPWIVERRSSLVGSPRLASTPPLGSPRAAVAAPEEVPAGFSMGDYCDEIPPELLYAEEPAAEVVVAPEVVEEKKDEEKSVKEEGEGQEEENDDDKGDEKSEKGEEDETTDKVKAKIEEKQNKEIEKLKKLYETKFISWFLKVIEVFTSIA